MKDIKNESSYPIVLTDSFQDYDRGLTKLELISAMCLQGLLGCQDRFDKETRAKYAIQSAKELLKQLEEIQEDTNK